MGLETDRKTKIGVSVVEAKELEALAELARSSPEKRAMMTLYRIPGEINAILPETYIRPHKYINPLQTETLVPLRGIAELVTFSDEGEILQRVLVGREIAVVAGVETNTWYTLVAHSPFVALEVKVHPIGYDREKDEVFAPWAPEKGTKEAGLYFENLRQKLGFSGDS